MHAFLACTLILVEISNVKASLRDICAHACYTLGEVIDMRDIGKNIKDLRAQKNITQDALAETLFVTRQTISNYETGRTRPDLDMLVRIADALDTDPNTILYGIQPAPETRQERRKLWIAAAISAVVTVVLFFLFPVAQELKREQFDSRLLFWLNIVLLPSYLFFLGWTFIQALVAYTTLTVRKTASARYILLAMAILGGLYLIIMSPYLFPGLFTQPIPDLWNTIIFTILGAHPKYNQSSFYLLVFLLSGGLSRFLTAGHIQSTR